MGALRRSSSDSCASTGLCCRTITRTNTSCFFLSEGMRSDVNREFAADFRTRLWFTYRRHFPAISGSQLTTDCGWGCCLRRYAERLLLNVWDRVTFYVCCCSGQILLAEGLVRHFLGRDWRWEETDDREQEVFHRQIIRWFGDFDRPDNLFGIHRLVNIGIGQQHGRKAGTFIKNDFRYETLTNCMAQRTGCICWLVDVSRR